MLTNKHTTSRLSGFVSNLSTKCIDFVRFDMATELQIVLNPSTYPNFLRFLKLKNVSVNRTEMTFSVSRNKGDFEWAGKNLSSVFCQRERLFDFQMWSLIYDVLRFNACSRKILFDRSPGNDISIGQYLSDNNYSESFRDNYLIVSSYFILAAHHLFTSGKPMTAAVWSTSPDKCALEFPARTLVSNVPIFFLTLTTK